MPEFKVPADPLTTSEWVGGLLVVAFIVLCIGCWISEIILRWNERKWSTTRFTPEQYEDFVRRAAMAGVKYREKKRRKGKDNLESPID